MVDYLGLNMSNAINIFLRKAVDHKGIPFSVNTESQRIGRLTADEITIAFNNIVEQDIASKQSKGLPVARADYRVTVALEALESISGLSAT